MVEPAAGSHDRRGPLRTSAETIDSGVDMAGPDEIATSSICLQFRLAETENTEAMLARAFRRWDLVPQRKVAPSMYGQ